MVLQPLPPLALLLRIRGGAHGRLERSALKRFFVFFFSFASFARGLHSAAALRGGSSEEALGSPKDYRGSKEEEERNPQELLHHDASYAIAR